MTSTVAAGELVQEVEALAEAVVSGNRRGLSRAITLVESRLPADEPRAVALLERLAPQAKGALRLGISGSPGAGKSSLIERLGCLLVERGMRPAVIAIDPSSDRTGGSLLGDKTRMTELAREPQAFVRPSPSGPGGHGVAPTTADVATVCAAAGYDPVLIETVGIGQAETSVVAIVDLLIIVLEPGAGDGLQGIKRGLLEWADIVVVHKADGERRSLAERSRTELLSALELLSGRRERVPVVCVSSLENRGLEELLSEVERARAELFVGGALAERRRQADVRLLRERLAAALLERYLGSAVRRDRVHAAEQRMRAGQQSLRGALRALLED